MITSIYLDRQIIAVCNQYRQDRPSAKEACGVLIGETSVDFKELWIHEVTVPQRLDKRSRTSFQLCDPSHQSKVDMLYNRSGGTSRFVGTWHTHPEAIPHYSKQDRDGWNLCQKENRDFPFLVFMIIGIEEIRLFTKKGETFQQKEFCII